MTMAAPVLAVVLTWRHGIYQKVTRNPVRMRMQVEHEDTLVLELQRMMPGDIVHRN